MKETFEERFPEPEPKDGDPFEWFSIASLKQIMDSTRTSKDPADKALFQRAKKVYERHGKSSGAHTLT